MTHLPEKIMVIEDDAGLRQMLEEELGDAGFRVRGAENADAGWKMLTAWSPDLLVSDLRLPGADGLELLARARSLPAPPAFIIITAFGSIPQAVEALKRGADDFLTKPLDLDHLVLCVNRALETRRLRKEVQHFRKVLGRDSFHGIIGCCTSMRLLFDNLRKIAKAGGPVLIGGESGVGKEMVARAIHEESNRPGKFIAVNCGGIPAELLESEFFGHTAGAFTGAGIARRGLFVEAEGGTLLLDEIAEMPLAMQAKLLRILEDGRIRPVGADREREVDVRIVAVTNRNLESEIAAGRFREDLYFRLETFQLQVPPLREREDDLDLLAARFIDLFSSRMNRAVSGISTEALLHLRVYPFPGNVRELRNSMERAVTFCTGAEITPEHLPERMRRPQTATRSDGALSDFPLRAEELPTMEEMSNRYLRFVLARTGGNKRRAASLLGIGRGTLYRKLEMLAG